MRSLATAWETPPHVLDLKDGEVHVWRANLEVDNRRLQSMRDCLSDDEKARADRFRFAEDRESYTVCRAILRLILSRYLGCPASVLRFRYNRYGKPALVNQSGDSTLRFNLSHSKALALYAVARGRELGIDLEYLDRGFAGEEIARRFFSPREVAELEALPGRFKTAAFFNCWTRKEAYVKARGEGLSIPLDQFEVSLAPKRPAALLRTAGGPDELRRWHMLELDPGEGYVAALAVEGPVDEIRFWQWVDLS